MTQVFDAIIIGTEQARPSLAERLTDNLDLDSADVTLDARGYIQVDDSLATNVPASWT